MSKVSITVDFNPTNPDEFLAVSNLLAVLGGHDSGEIVADAPPAKTTRKRPSRTKKTPPPSETPNEEHGADDTADDTAEEGEGSLYTRDRVREALSAKVKIGDNKEKIKAKLAKMGSKNVTLLDEKHFDAMYKFLEGLPAE